MSSGFDSSFLGSITQSILGKNNTEVNQLKYSERSGAYNKFEVESKKITEFLDIKIILMKSI